MTELNNLRKKIDNQDEEILKALSVRFSLVKEIWEYKRKNKLTAIQEERWKEVQNNINVLAHDMNLNTIMIEEIYNIIHKYSLKRQEKVKLNTK